MADDTNTYSVKLLKAKKVQTEKKKIFVKFQVEGEKEQKSTPSEIEMLTWNEVFLFPIKKEVKKKTIKVSLCAKGTFKAEELATGVIDVTNVHGTRGVKQSLVLEKKKGAGELDIEVACVKEGTAAVKRSSLEENYEMGEQIGAGGFAVVYKGIEKATGDTVAIKCIDKSGQGNEQLMMLEREIDIMKRLKHKNIVRLYDVADAGDKIYIVMEFVGGGELYKKIVERGHFSEFDSRHIIRQVLDAIAYCHENEIAHRDLKPENLLCTGPKGMDIRVTDFGLSKDYGDMGDSSTSACGSPSYVAPEVLDEGNYTNACDIWSTGVILYVLLCGNLPFFAPTQDALFEKIKSGVFKFGKGWKNISEEAKDLIRKMLTLDPTKRPSAKECLEHPWFRMEIKKVAVKKKTA